MANRLALEGSLRVAIWQKKGKAEQIQNLELILPEVRQWTEREVDKRTTFCPLLFSLIPSLGVAEIKAYLVSWVVQAVLIAPLMSAPNQTTAI